MTLTTDEPTASGRATDAKIEERVQSLVQFMRGGGGPADIFQFVAERELAGEEPWKLAPGRNPLSERTIERYVARAMKPLREESRKSMNEIIRLHFAKPKPPKSLALTTRRRKPTTGADRATKVKIEQRVQVILQLLRGGGAGAGRADIIQLVAERERAGEEPWKLAPGRNPLSERTIERYLAMATERFRGVDFSKIRSPFFGGKKSHFL